MGAALGRAAVSQGIKAAGKAAAKNITKAAIKKLAIKGAKVAAKQGVYAAGSYGVSKAFEGRGRRVKRMKRTTRKIIRGTGIPGRKSNGIVMLIPPYFLDTVKRSRKIIY